MKCEFHVPVISFLGYIIGRAGDSTDPGKVKAVTTWTIPSSMKELQRFLGFANFYQRFIHGFSAIAAPLTTFLKGNPRSLKWNRMTEEAFGHLKQVFTTALVLKHPDHSQPFIMEVDTSDVGVGAILSQCFGESPKHHPVVFFSKKLTPTEQSYDIRDRELLAMKLALEEWRYWLEGATFPFTIFTDHKKLEYLSSAKRLNARQAHWALFFAKFTFTVHYQLGSKKIKVDALSRQDLPSKLSEDAEMILQAHMLH